MYQWSLLKHVVNQSIDLAISHMERAFKIEQLWFGGAANKFLALILYGNDNKKVAVPFVSQSNDVIDQDY